VDPQEIRGQSFANLAGICDRYGGNMHKCTRHRLGIQPKSAKDLVEMWCIYGTDPLRIRGIYARDVVDMTR